jgi:hypothetical protein
MEKNKNLKYIFGLIFFATIFFIFEKIQNAGISISFDYLTKNFSPPVAFLLLVITATAVSLPLFWFLVYGGSNNPDISRVKDISRQNWLIIILVTVGGLYLAYMFFILSIGAPMPSFFGYLNKLYSQFVLGGL